MHSNLEALAESRATPSAFFEAPARPSLLAWLVEVLKHLAKQQRGRRHLNSLDAHTLKDIGLAREITGGQPRYYPTLDARR